MRTTAIQILLISIISCSHEKQYIHTNKMDVSGMIYREKASFREHVFTYHKYGDVDVSFKGTQFCEYADFTKCNFQDSVDVCFGRTVFYQDADFKYAVFKGYAGFWMSKFNDNADFQGAKFLHKAGVDFRGATFLKDVNFTGATLTNPDFNGVVFCGKISFKDCKIIGHINLMNIKSSGNFPLYQIIADTIIYSKNIKINN